MPLVWIPYDDSQKVKDSFFQENPVSTLKKKSYNAVPTMIGLTKDEGLLQAGHFINDAEVFKNFWKEEACPAVLFLGYYSYSRDVPDNVRQLTEEISQKYFQGNKEHFDLKVLQQLSDAFTDSGFFYGTDIMVKQLADKVPTFYYHFDHLGSFSFLDLVASKYGVLFELMRKKFEFHHTLGHGVCHADEIFHLFR